MYILDC